MEESGGEWCPREARRRRWQTVDFAEVADSGDDREACTRQMKVRVGRGRGAQMQDTRKPRKLGKPRVAQESDGRPGEAVADVEDPEAAGAGEGVDGAGGFRQRLVLN